MTLEDWQRLGPDIPLLVDLQPAGRFLGENFHRAGGVPAVMKELLDAGKLHGDVMTVTGRTLAENLRDVPDGDREVIRAYDEPMKEAAGYVVMSGNLFDSAVMKISVIDKEFRRRFLSNPERPNVFEGKAIVFEGPEDYHDRIEDPDARRRRAVRADHPQLRPGRLSRQRRGGEHAAAGVAAEARHRRRCRPWATGGSPAPRAPPRS